MNTNWFSSRAKRRAAYELDDAILRGDASGASGNLDTVVQDTVAQAILELRAAQARINADPSVTEPPATLMREFRAALAPVANSVPAFSSTQVAKRPSPLRPVVALAAAVVILGGGGVALAANGSLPAPIQSGLADVVGVVGISIPDASNSPSNEVADSAQNDSVNQNPNQNPNQAGSRPKALDRASEAGIATDHDVEVVAMQNWCLSRDNKLATKKKLDAMTKACRDLSEISSDSPEVVVALATFKTEYEQVKSLLPQAWKNELMAISDPARPRRQTGTDSGRPTETTKPRPTETTQPRPTVPSTAPRISDDQRRAAENARRAAEDARRAAERAAEDARRAAENARRDAERAAKNSETKTPAEPSA